MRERGSILESLHMNRIRINEALGLALRDMGIVESAERKCLGAVLEGNNDTSVRDEKLLQAIGKRLHINPRNFWTEKSIKCLGKTFKNVTVLGDVECWGGRNNSVFFQYAVTGGKVYQFFYDTDGLEALDLVDFDHPIDYEDVTDEWEDEIEEEVSTKKVVEATSCGVKKYKGIGSCISAGKELDGKGRFLEVAYDCKADKVVWEEMTKRTAYHGYSNPNLIFIDCFREPFTEQQLKELIDKAYEKAMSAEKAVISPSVKNAMAVRDREIGRLVPTVFKTLSERDKRFVDILRDEYRGSVWAKKSQKCQGKTFKNIVFICDDECWDKDEFFTFGVSDGKVYKFYIDTSEYVDMEDIYYDNPYRYEEVTHGYESSVEDEDYYDWLEG